MKKSQTEIIHLSWIDACRVFAIFGVIVIHVVGPIVNDYKVISLEKFLVANTFDSLFRASVPLFVMISGALTLPKKVTLQETKNRVIRVVIPLIFWSFIYCFWINTWTVSP